MECVKSLLFLTPQQAKKWRKKACVTEIVLVLFQISTIYTDIYIHEYMCVHEKMRIKKEKKSIRVFPNKPANPYIPR